MFNDIKYEFIKIDKKNTSFHLRYSYGKISGKDLEIKLEDLSEDEALNDQIVRIVRDSIMHDKKNEAISYFKDNEGGKIPFFFLKEGESLNDEGSLSERNPDIYFSILEFDNVNVKIRSYSSLFKKEESEYPEKTYNIDEFIMEEFDIKDALLKRCENDIVSILNSEKNLKTEDSNDVVLERKGITFIN